MGSIRFTLAGTVTEFHLVSPHTQIHFDVKDAQGNTMKWVALTGPPQRMHSWRSDTLKAGDQITVSGPFQERQQILRREDDHG